MTAAPSGAPDVTITVPAALAAAAGGDAVRDAIRAAVEAARPGGGPARVEIRTAEPRPERPAVGLAMDGHRIGIAWWIVAEAMAYSAGATTVARTSGEATAQFADLAGDEPRLAETLALVLRHGLDRPTGTDADAVIGLRVRPEYLRALSEYPNAADSIAWMRTGLFSELGVIVPAVRTTQDPDLRPNGFAIDIGGRPGLPRIGIAPGRLVVNASPEALAGQGIDATPTAVLAGLIAGSVVALEHRAALEAQGYTTWDPVGYLVLMIADAVRRRAADLVDATVVATQLAELAAAFPQTVAAAEAQLDVDALVALLRRLVGSAVSIRDLRRILMLVARHAAAEHPPDLETFVRHGLSDAIAHKFSRGAVTVVAYLLDATIVRAVRGLTAGDRDELAERVARAVAAELAELPPLASRPVVLTDDDVRAPLQALLADEQPRLVVLGYADLPAHAPVQPVARIVWADADAG